MRLRKRVWGVGLALVLFVTMGIVSLGAQSPGVGLSGGLGTEVINKVTYQTMSVIPDFPIGPVGLGIDLSFHFRFFTTNDAGVQSDFGFYPRVEDFWDSTAPIQENLSKWTSRIAYVRYGVKGDPINLQVGVLPNVTLGNGFILGRYSNGMLQPVQRFTGLVANLDGSLFQFPFVGLETVTDNISSFDLVGLRVYVKPFGLLLPDVAFLRDLQVGATAVVDTNPYIYAYPTASSPGTAMVAGLDTSLTLLADPLMSAKAFADFAVQNGHTGGTVGLGGTVLGLVSWGLQNRFLGLDFIPSYFNKTYDLSRDSQYAFYTGTATSHLPATLAWEASLGGRLLDTISFGASLGGPYGSAVSATPTKFELPKLESFFTIARNPILPVTVDAYYNKDKLTSLSDLLSPQSAVIGARIGYVIGSATITMVYNLKYIENATDPNELWETSSKIETAIKLF